LKGKLTSVPAEIWLLTDLKTLDVRLVVRSFFASIHRRFFAAAWPQIHEPAEQDRAADEFEVVECA